MLHYDDNQPKPIYLYEAYYKTRQFFLNDEQGNTIEEHDQKELCTS